MASSSSVFGDLIAGKSGKQSKALTLCDLTIAPTSSALQPVGDRDVEMVTPEKRIVLHRAKYRIERAMESIRRVCKRNRVITNE